MLRTRVRVRVGPFPTHCPPLVIVEFSSEITKAEKEMSQKSRRGGEIEGGADGSSKGAYIYSTVATYLYCTVTSMVKAYHVGHI